MFNKPAMPPQPLPTQAASGQSAPIIKPGASEDVYIMPEKFHSEPAKGSSNKPLIIAGIILAAVVILVGAYFIYDWSVQQQLAAQQAIQNAAMQLSTPIVEEVNEGLLVTPEPVTTTEPAVTTPTTTQTTTSPATTPTTTEPALTPPPLSRDSDGDGLTDIEEDVIGTNPVKPDTDIDGYKDSDEILAGYNPLSDGSQGKAKLSESDAVSLAQSSFAQNNFSFLYPRRFKVSFISESGQAIISADTGEIIRLSSQPDEQKVSAMNWYLQAHPQVSVSQLKIISTAQLTGFFTPDGLTAYLTDVNKERIYSFEYIANPQTEFRYPTLFAMIIKNFKIGTSTPATSTPAGQ
jgi:hypothetical protein